MFSLVFSYLTKRRKKKTGYNFVYNVNELCARTEGRIGADLKVYERESCCSTASRYK